MRPQFYPHHCERVELQQTMMSWVLLAGEFVYKIKKPVRFPFLDAATAAKRYRLCADEVALNRRLAPDVYLGIKGIAEDHGVYCLVDDVDCKQSGVREFAVVMRRLPSERILNRMIADNAVSASDMREIAKKLVSFHANASIAKASIWGSARAISRFVVCNVAHAHQIAADSVTRELLATVAAYVRRYVVARRQSLDNRARDGHVREGHGDLRSKSVYFGPDDILILDCAEYSERMRYGDTASELASLAVDLELAERPELADALLEDYAAQTHDSEFLALLRFYKCHRAVLRGKLETLASLQLDLPAEQRVAARSNARRLFALAHSYVSESAAPDAV